MPPIVLFVCTGNLCRSPMAAGLFRKRLEEEGLEDAYEVRSAGVSAVEGAPASFNALRAMEEYGVDLGTHRAHLLTPDDVRQADVVVVMEQYHADAIVQRLPEEAHKVHLLTELAGEEGDVEDVYGLGLEDYREAAEEIRGLLDAAWQEILRLADAHHAAAKGREPPA
ncbi:MAG: low molecular weight protein arginine phosphatase [Anaerolineae bacterium]|nr:low molecular weight protein arginine phosphatase [Anaerolineae bacterium]